MGQNSVDVGALAAAPAAGDKTQVIMLRTTASVVLGLAGLYYLLAGKRDQDLKSMFLGGALILLASLVLVL